MCSWAIFDKDGEVVVCVMRDADTGVDHNFHLYATYDAAMSAINLMDEKTREGLSVSQCGVA